MILLVDSEGPDQTVGMRRLIWAFSVPICSKDTFHMVWLKWKERRKISMLKLFPLVVIQSA